MAKTILHTPVMTKARRRFGRDYPSQATTFNAEIVPGESIRIWGTYSNREFDRTFKLGEYAVYGSYNLIYTGEIVKIGAKTVTVKHYRDSDRVTQMDLNTFVWRNFDYDAQRIADRNADTMMYI